MELTPQEIEVYKARMKAFDDLWRMPAWKEYANALRQAAESEKTQAAKAPSPHEFGMRVGRTWAFEAAASWPEREIAQIRSLLGYT